MRLMHIKRFNTNVKPFKGSNSTIGNCNICYVSDLIYGRWNGLSDIYLEDNFFWNEDLSLALLLNWKFRLFWKSLLATLIKISKYFR
jgi:hypothetical protein